MSMDFTVSGFGICSETRLGFQMPNLAMHKMRMQIPALSSKASLHGLDVFGRETDRHTCTYTYIYIYIERRKHGESERELARVIGRE